MRQGSPLSAGRVLLYEGNATGKIPDNHFNRMLIEYDKEQSSLEQEFSELRQTISAQRQDYENPQRFIPLVKRHTDFTEPYHAYAQ